MKKNTKAVTCIIARYLLIISFALGNFYILRKILTRPTIAVLTTILHPFLDITVYENYIFVSGTIAEIATSCIVASAFFLLFLLNFSTPQIKPFKRLLILAISFLCLFAFNIARMFFLIFIITTPYLQISHLILRELLLPILVTLIWLGLAVVFKIKSIPFYSDFKFLKQIL